MAKKNGVSEKTTQATQVQSVKEIRLNQDLCAFLAQVIEQKLASPGNKEKLVEMYQEQVGLKFTNCERVIKRSNRTGLAELKAAMLKEYGVTMAQAKGVEDLMRELSKERGDRNYLSVQVPA